MKVTKALKALKFWSKKKKKKKKKINNNIHHNSPPPPCCRCCFHHHHETVQPSAPPLPSWLDYEDQMNNQQHLLESEVNFNEFPGLPVSYEAQIDLQEDEIGKIPPVNRNRSAGDVESGCSYQQYMVENPVYEMAVLPVRKTERSAGGVGCVFDIGAHLFRCFFPCFHVREL